MRRREAEDKPLIIIHIDNIFSEDGFLVCSISVERGIETIKEDELVGLNSKGFVGAGKRRVVNRVEEEAKELGA